MTGWTKAAGQAVLGTLRRYPDNALALALGAVEAGRPIDMCYRPAPDRLTVCTLPRGHAGPHSFSGRRT